MLIKKNNNLNTKFSFIIIDIKAESENIKPLIVSDKLIKLKQAIDKYIKFENNN
jgi:hypothetical protein